MNALVRLLYRIAAALLRVWARVRHPTVRGAAVLVWREGALLLIQTSYQPWRGLPGGRVGRNEDPRATAVRELREETGLAVEPAALENLGTWIVDHSGLEDHVHAFSCRASQTGGALRVDEREIVWADFVDLDEVRGLELWPPLREILRDGVVPS